MEHTALQHLVRAGQWTACTVSALCPVHFRCGRLYVNLIACVLLDSCSSGVAANRSIRLLSLVGVS